MVEGADDDAANVKCWAKFDDSQRLTQAPLPYDEKIKKTKIEEQALLLLYDKRITYFHDTVWVIECMAGKPV